MIDFENDFEFLWCGKFISPDGSWVHDARQCDSYEIFYVTEGTLYIADDENEYTVAAGEYLITDPGNQHGWKSSHCSFYWFHFEYGVGTSLRSHGQFYDIDKIEKYYSLLHSYNGNRSGGMIIPALLCELMTQKSEKPVSGICNSVREYIRFATAADLRVAHIAEQFSYSPRYLSHIFCAEVGVTLKQYIKDEMITRAKHLLENTNLSINDIGTGLGYSDGHNFSHAFKNATGMSPNGYRQKKG